MINQVRFSKDIKYFKKGFMEHWDVEDYHDPDKPAFFAGMYSHSDLNALHRHKGFKVVWLTGTDRRHAKQVMSIPNVVFCMDDLYKEWFIENVGRLPERYKEVRLPIKNYNVHKPTVLGKNVYCYIGNNRGGGKFSEQTLMEIESKSRHPFIYGIRGHTMHELIDKFYNESFINIKLNPFAGTTSAYELAFMGRPSVSNMSGDWYLKWETVDDIVETIENESKKIGTMPECLVPDNHFVGDEWKQINYWKCN